MLDGQELVSLALRLMELLGVSCRVEVENLGTHVCGDGSPAEGRTDQAADDRCIGVRRSALLDAESESLLVGHTVANPAKEVECKHEHVLKLVLVLADIPVSQSGDVVIDTECGNSKLLGLFEPDGEIFTFMLWLALGKILR